MKIDAYIYVLEAYFSSANLAKSASLALKNKGYKVVMFNARGLTASQDNFKVDNKFSLTAFPDVFQTTIKADNNRGLFFCFPDALTADSR